MPLRIRLLALFFLCLFVQEVHAQKTDIVILNNGDRITGEIKQLETGLLSFSTDAMGTVTIEWRLIRQVISNKQQTVETIDGQRVLGKLRKPAEGDNVEIITADGPLVVAAEDVVSVWPVQATLLDKLDLSFSIGFDYQKSTDITNVNIAADALYLEEDRVVEGSFRSNVTSQADGDDQNRQEIRANLQKLLGNRRFRSVNISYDKNEAIGLDYRISAGGSYGKYFVKSNRTWFVGEIGAIVTQETPLIGSTTEAIEGVLGTRYRYFSYARPERVLDTTLTVFPGLTDWGRVRANLRSTFRLELVKDLFWTMEFYATYDNEPVEVGAEKSDYGIITGLGWKY